SRIHHFPLLPPVSPRTRTEPGQLLSASESPTVRKDRRPRYHRTIRRTVPGSPRCLQTGSAIDWQSLEPVGAKRNKLTALTVQPSNPAQIFSSLDADAYRLAALAAVEGQEDIHRRVVVVATD